MVSSRSKPVQEGDRGGGVAVHVEHLQVAGVIQRPFPGLSPVGR
jgi:hypothetical protein